MNKNIVSTIDSIDKDRILKKRQLEKAKKAIDACFEIGQFFKRYGHQFYFGRPIIDIYQTALDICLDNEIDTKAHFIEEAYRASINLFDTWGEYRGDECPSSFIRVESFYTKEFPDDYREICEQMGRKRLFELYFR